MDWDIPQYLRQDHTPPIEALIPMCSRSFRYAHGSVAHPRHQGWCSSQYIYITNETSHATGVKKGRPWAPPLYDTGEESLLRVICNVGCETVNSSSKMTISTADNLWGFHSGFESFKNFAKRRMKNLSSEFLKFGIVRMSLVGCVASITVTTSLNGTKICTFRNCENSNECNAATMCSTDIIVNGAD